MRIAVLVPCYNEAVAIPQVVRDFHKALPDAEIWVFDNNSKDGTGEIAARELPCVTTPTGMQGLGAVAGFMPASADPQVFSDHVVRMLSDADEWRRVSAA